MVPVGYIILAIIAFGMLAYAVYANKRIRKSKQDLQDFLASLSRSFHNAKWEQVDIPSKDGQTNEKIAEIINDKIKRDMEYDFKVLFPSLYFFPSRCFKFFTEDQATNNFSAQTFPIIKTSYQEYRAKKASLDELTLALFTKTKEIILLELEKEDTLSTKKN